MLALKLLVVIVLAAAACPVWGQEKKVDATVYDEVAELVKSDGNIRFVLKEFPILGEDSIISSKFAISVLQLHGNEPYKKVHDTLIALRGSPDAETLTRLATELGLDPALASGTFPDVIVPRGLTDAMKAGGPDGHAFITATDSVLAVAWDGGAIIARLIPGTYPNTDQMIPRTCAATVDEHVGGA